MQHTINFTNESTQSGRAKPARVPGAEIRVKTGGAAPTDHKDCHYAGTDTRAPYVLRFEGTDAGQPACYMLRWVSISGEPGPWSETMMATVTV